MKGAVIDSDVEQIVCRSSLSATSHREVVGGPEFALRSLLFVRLNSTNLPSQPFMPNRAMSNPDPSYDRIFGVMPCGCCYLPGTQVS